MLKRLWMIPVLLLVLSQFQADAYTVILKNGKTMKGTLVTENDSTIIFKDEKGVQYSLRKASLDLEKMKEANVPAPAPASAAAPAAPAQPSKPAPAAKKPAKVYTASDVQAIRDKVRLSGATEGPGGEMVDPSTPAGYYKGLMEGVNLVSATMNDLGSLLDGMNTDWEVSSSTGRDPVPSLQKYKAGKAYADITANIKTNLSELQSLHDSLQPPRSEYRAAFDALGSCIESLDSYTTAVAQYAGDPPVQAFRTSLQKYSDAVDTSLGQIQKAPAPAGAQPADQNTTPPPQ